MTPHAKSFVKNLFGLEKALGVTRYDFSRMTGKHRDVLKNWKSKKTSPDTGDIAHVCKRLSRELADRNRFVGFISKGSEAIRQFVTVEVEKSTFRTKKVSC